MKKLLIASTALVATASVAAAEINFSGYGRFGVLYEKDRSRAATATETANGVSSNGTALNADGTVPLDETRLESRFRLNIDGVTQADNGVRFAARMRVEANDNADGSAASGAFSGARFQVSAGGFRVRVGNISGVADSGSITNTFGFEPGLIGQIGHYGTFAGGSLPFTAFSSTGAGVNGINVLYEVGDFAIMGSWNQDFDNSKGSTTMGFDDQYEVGVAYTFSGWTAGLVGGNIKDKQTTLANGATANTNWWIATVSGSVGIADLAVFVGKTDIDAAEGILVNPTTNVAVKDKTSYGISGSVPVGANTSINGAIAGGGADYLKTEYGIGVRHSLGGGARIDGMIGRNAQGNTVGDLGVRFDF